MPEIVEMKPRVLVACVDNHNTNIKAHVDSLTRFWYEASDLIHSGEITMHKEGGNVLDFERSKIAQICCAGDYTHLFFYDADNEISLSHLQKLMSRNVDVISGTYFMRSHKVRMEQDGIKVGEQFPCVASRGIVYVTREEIKQAAAKDELLSVDTVGCGCLLIKAEALRDIGYPAFRIDWKVGPYLDFTGEDQYFCKTMRQTGRKIYLDPTVRPDHYAMIRSNFSLKDMNNYEFYTPNY